MSDAITLFAEQRDLLRCRIWIHTSRLDKVWLKTRPGPKYSVQEAEQIREEMQQVVAGLGQRGTLDEQVALRIPPNVLRRVFEFMLHMAGGGDPDDARDEASEDFPEYEDRHVRAMCGRVLAQLDRASTAPAGSTDG